MQDEEGSAENEMGVLMDCPTDGVLFLRKIKTGGVLISVELEF